MPKAISNIEKLLRLWNSLSQSEQAFVMQAIKASQPVVRRGRRPGIPAMLVPRSAPDEALAYQKLPPDSQTSFGKP